MCQPVLKQGRIPIYIYLAILYIYIYICIEGGDHQARHVAGPTINRLEWFKTHATMRSHHMCLYKAHKGYSPFTDDEAFRYTTIANKYLVAMHLTDILALLYYIDACRTTSI